MPNRPANNFEIQKYYQNKPKFKRFYSTNSLFKIKDGTQVINHHECKSLVNHCIDLQVYGDNGTYFDSFGVEYIPKEINNFMGKNIKANIFRMQANDSITWGQF